MHVSVIYGDLADDISGTFREYFQSSIAFLARNVFFPVSVLEQIGTKIKQGASR